MKIACHVEEIVTESLNHPDDMILYINGTAIHVNSMDNLIIEDLEDKDAYRYASTGESGRKRARDIGRWITEVLREVLARKIKGDGNERNSSNSVKIVGA